MMERRGNLIFNTGGIKTERECTLIYFYPVFIGPVKKAIFHKEFLYFDFGVEYESKSKINICYYKPANNFYFLVHLSKTADATVLDKIVIFAGALFAMQSMIILPI